MEAFALPCAPNDIRRLLRALRRPHTLEQMPLAARLQAALGAHDAKAAVLELVAGAFEGGPPRYALLRDIVQRCDLAGQPTQAVADALHLSPRQFFRYRAEALAAVHAAAQAALEAAAAPAGGLAELTALVLETPPDERDALVRQLLVVAARLRARRGGSPYETAAPKRAASRAGISEGRSATGTPAA